MPETMKAWKAARPGSVADTLALHEDTPKPSADSLTSGQIIVQTSRIGLNPADYKICEVGLVSRILTSFPKTLGMDLSGRVIAVAEDVKDTAPGDLVLARVDPRQSGGTFAEFAVVDRDGYATVPADFDLDQAAGAPTAGMTAYQTIKPHTKAGDKVFINGGSGGVGLFGIQVAKALGCHVTVTCSTAKAALCRSVGADDVIDYKKSDVVEELGRRGQVFALCVDNLGSSPANLYASSHEFLLPGGKLVFVGGQMSVQSVASLSRSLLLPGFLGGGKRKFVGYATANVRADLETVRDLLVEGKIKTVIDSTFAFDEIPKAIEYVKKGSSAGKNIVRVQ